jgi:hypothetical protein
MLCDEVAQNTHNTAELCEEFVRDSHHRTELRAESGDTNSRVWRLERIMLAMCEQNSTDLTNADIGDLAFPPTAPGIPSPVSNLCGLSISRGRSGGSPAQSAHSSARSANSGKSSDIYIID